MRAMRALVVFIILLVALSSVYLISKIEETAPEVKICPKLQETESVDQIEFLRLYDFRTNAISYLECSKDKNRTIELFYQQKNSTSALTSVYIMYLYKTGQEGDSKILEELYDRLNIKNLPLHSKDDFIKVIHDFLSIDDAKIENSELNLLKDIDTNKTLKEAESDEIILYRYFNNILKFRDSKNIEDCQEITIINSLPNDLLRDTCELAFSSDKMEYCGEIIKKEIKACEES